MQIHSLVNLLLFCLVLVVPTTMTLTTTSSGLDSANPLAIVAKGQTKLWKRSLLEKRAKEEILSEEEAREIVAELARNPSATLWDVFAHQAEIDISRWIHHPQWLITRLPILAVEGGAKVLVQILYDVVSFLKWLVHAVQAPRDAKQDVKSYFKQIKEGLKALHQMWKESHRKALANFFGGFLIYVTHHGVEFTAQLVLLLVVGGAVFHQLGEMAEGLVESVGVVKAGSAAGLKNGAMAFLWFLHCIDDPLMIAPAIMNGVTSSLTISSSHGNGTIASVNVTAVNQSISLNGSTVNQSINGTAGTVNQTTPIINHTSSTAKASWTDFNNETTRMSYIRSAIFGSPTEFDAMSLEERKSSFKHFQEYICKHYVDSNGTVPLSWNVLVPGISLQGSALEGRDTAIVYFDCPLE